MDVFLLWLGLGLVLIVVELLTGTLYLLFLGLAALVTAAAAFFGVGFWAQAVVAAGCSVAGVLWVNRHKRSINSKPMPSLDVGQSVVLESWVDQAGGLARVRYRDASWDARVRGECSGQPGEVLHIHAVEGSTLVVAKSPAT